jgi:glycosyltransferase involved in cell wall biosynthesis
MTICIATSNYFPDTGGISTYSQRLAALLQMEGHQAIVITIDYNSTVDEPDSITCQTNGVTVVRLKQSFRKLYTYYSQHFRSGGIDAPYWIAMGKSMHDWLFTFHKNYHIDIIEASAFGGIGAFLLQKNIPPVALSGHGAFFQYKKFNRNKEDEQTRLIERLEKTAFRHADGLISHSPQSQLDMHAHTSKNIYLACIPILPEKNEWEKRPEIIPSKGLVVGSLQKLKGPEILCKALKDERIQNSNLEVVWAGSDNFDHETGKSMSEKLEEQYPTVWGKKLQWENMPDDKKLDQLYNEAAFIIIPTIWESFNVISIEAAFHRKPVIITEKTGSSFLFTNGHNALIIPSGNEKALADAILALAMSASTCRKMGEAAYHDIALTLTPKKIITERIAIYKEIISIKNLSTDIADLSFLNRYTNIFRRFYFAVRKLVKKIAVKN